MAQRINEDIRFYLPSDPYYYQVDNLPLQDLLNNDVILQNQLDEVNTVTTSTVGRQGFQELQPWINGAVAGSVSVRPGSFIGRVQRSAGGHLPGATAHRGYDGLGEVKDPPTDQDGYNVALSPNTGTGLSKFVGRTAVFNFPGGSIPIEGFDFNAFSSPDGTQTSPPLGRIDLVGITTVNGAMDDPYLPGNPTGSGQVIGDGYPKLAVVKGAGIVVANNGVRQVVVGEKYITVGAPQEQINDYGRNLDGNVVPNPEFGTVPSPDDVVNACFANNSITQTLIDFAERNANASFFLPLAYMFVPQAHVNGTHLPAGYLHDIRPFFRTAELALSERQALAASINPSIENRVITKSDQTTNFLNEVNRTAGYPALQDQIQSMHDDVNSVTIQKQFIKNSLYNFRSGSISTNGHYNIQGAIEAQHAGKNIVSVEIYVRPYGGTGDISTGWIGFKLLGGHSRWLMNWGNTIKHSSYIIAGPGTATMAPYGSNQNGDLWLKGTRSGSSQNVHCYIAGYTYEEQIVLAPIS